MAGGIFLVQNDDQLIELNEQPYEAEEVLQRLLADHPNILAGDQIDPSTPRRWLLISREAGIPDVAGGSGRWALDHLFLDQDAVPTLVEVKRSSDTRTRREVVGQMLDYAANAVVYWPAEAIRAQFETSCALSDRDPEQTLEAFLEPDMDLEEFWQAAKQNLQAQRIRLVFVADVIPPELRRIVEFLNGQMTPAEVLAIEVRQFVGQDIRALVPRVVGQTASAQQAKAAVSSASKRTWDEDSFFQALSRRKNAQEAAIAQEIYRWAINAGLRIKWGAGKIDGSFYPMIDHPGGSRWVISVWTSGVVTFPFMDLGFLGEEKRLALLRRVNEIPGVSLPQEALTRLPSIPLSALTDAHASRTFFDAIGWLVAELRASLLT